MRRDQHGIRPGSGRFEALERRQSPILAHSRRLLALRHLRRDTGWAGRRNPLGRLIRYLTACRSMLVDYRRRRAAGLAISSVSATSARRA